MTEREGLPTVEILATNPGEILRIVETVARDMAVAHSLWLTEIEPLGWALRRLLGDLSRSASSCVGSPEICSPEIWTACLRDTRVELDTGRNAQVDVSA